MKPKWLIEDFDDDNNYKRLAEEVECQGYECEIITYIPSESGNYNRFPDEDCVIVQASLGLAGQLMRQKKWVPGPWLNLDAYECSNYYAYIGRYLLNDDYIILPRSEFYRTRKKWFEIYGKERCLFIRPSSGFKTFTGQVFSLEFFERDWEWVQEFTSPESLIVITSPKNVKAEWRFVAAEGKIIAGSRYRTNCKSDYKREWPDEAFRLAEVIANEYNPDPIYVVDICQGADDKYYLLEIGSFSCAGLYACDMEPIVRVVSTLALKCWDEIYSI